VVNQSTEVLWPKIRDFWINNGFVLVLEDRPLGIMETDWAENRAKLPQDFIRKTLGRVLEGLYSTGERDKFRTRLEPVGENTTEIYLTHKGMIEELTKDNNSTIWVTRPRDPELENEFLRRIMLNLGLSAQQSEQLLATEQVDNSQSNSQIITTNFGPAIRYKANFNQTWRLVGLALDRNGFTIEDKNRTAGFYIVRYVDPKLEVEEPGFFGRLFGSDPVVNEVKQYRIQIVPHQEKSLITLVYQDSTPVDTTQAQQILEIIISDLK
jgi:outer membrane protein assembly factor BamC